MNRFSIQQQVDRLYEGSNEQRRPIIGITANYGEQTAKLAEGYYKQVVRAGGTPMLIPPLADREVLLDTLDHIDGLLLSGGADINPLFQGEEPQPKLGGINDERDLPELLITRLAYNRQMPILGICRGIQTLVMALGGRVDQDIESRPRKDDDEEPAAPIKHSQDAGRDVPTHSVSVDEGSTLFNIFKEQFLPLTSYLSPLTSPTLYVNSFHHQAVSDPGGHLRTTATAPDGVIEAVESTELKPVLGVQWHPECMGEDGLPLFSWLVEQASAYREAQHLHDRTLTLDTHCDTPMLFPKGVDFTKRDDRLLVDLPKMTEGRLDATIMVAYIPQAEEAQQKLLPLMNAEQFSPYDYANIIFDKIEDIVKKDNRLALARTPDELWLNKHEGRKSIMLGIENGLALEGRVDRVEHFARRGVVYITLCHNGDNDICDSAKGTQTHGGLSTLGEQVIRQMNNLGLMVDLSHAAESSFYDALSVSQTPIVCSHSSCRALCDHPRNLTDEQMRALAKKGGVCQITLYPGFLKIKEISTILDAIDHLEHAIKVMGIDHVGLGSDFDGDGGVRGLADASELTLFTRQLLSRRFSDEDIQKIWGGNFLRVMRQVQSWKPASAPEQPKSRPRKQTPLTL